MYILYASINDIGTNISVPQNKTVKFGGRKKKLIYRKAFKEN